jgi:predicted transcriptional regulator
MTTSVRISDEQYEKVRMIAVKERRKIQVIIEQALNNFFIAKKIHKVGLRQE